MIYRQSSLPPQQSQPQPQIANNWGSGEQWKAMENGGMIYSQKQLPRMPIGGAQNWGGNAFG
jgi:hypothetical protein